jgi:hypothetical protein
MTINTCGVSKNDQLFGKDLNYSTSIMVLCIFSVNNDLFFVYKYDKYFKNKCKRIFYVLMFH